MLQDQIKTNWKLIVFFTLCLQFASLGQQISELQNEITGILRCFARRMTRDVLPSMTEGSISRVTQNGAGRTRRRTDFM